MTISSNLAQHLHYWAAVPAVFLAYKMAAAQSLQLSTQSAES